MYATRDPELQPQSVTLTAVLAGHYAPAFAIGAADRRVPLWALIGLQLGSAAAPVPGSPQELALSALVGFALMTLAAWVAGRTRGPEVASCAPRDAHWS